MVLSFSGLLDTCRGRMCIKFSNMASKITAYASVYATLDIIKLSAICTTKSFQKKKTDLHYPLTKTVIFIRFG